MPIFARAARPNLLRTAATLARERHAGQLRKGTDRPYFVHPAGVAGRLLYYYPADVELVAAGFLHDLLEDTPTEAAELEARFGRRVRTLVEAVTKRPGVAWRLPAGDRAIARLKAADVLDNLDATADDLADVGPAVWDRFVGGQTRKRAYYDGLVAELSVRLAGEPIALALQSARDRCFR